MLIAAGVALGGDATDIAGRWQGTIRFDDVVIGFPAEFVKSAQGLELDFFNGPERVRSTRVERSADKLTVAFEHYAMRLEATIVDGAIRGRYGQDGFYGWHDFELHRRAAPRAAHAGPPIAGVWTVPHETDKGEHAWRLIVKQHDDAVSAAILRVDGDTGLLTGAFDGKKFVLDHFDGARAVRLEIVPHGDAELTLTMRGFHTPEQVLTAVRSGAERDDRVPKPSDSSRHTRVRNPNEPFRFAFASLDGQRITDADPRFRNKVILINVTGSWCPNCHDEAPFLQELYRRYRPLGLEVVALSFEESEQLKNPARLKAFIAKYGITYTYLLAGEIGDEKAALPQAVNLNAFPTTFFLGKDRRVRAVHAGFAAKASAQFHDAMRREFVDTIEKLLAEADSTRSAAKNQLP
jgi:thiol-disulfide isomerase/thioredoxin